MLYAVLKAGSRVIAMIRKEILQAFRKEVMELFREFEKVNETYHYIMDFETIKIELKKLPRLCRRVEAKRDEPFQHTVYCQNAGCVLEYCDVEVREGPNRVPVTLARLEVAQWDKIMTIAVSRVMFIRSLEIYGEPLRLPLLLVKEMLELAFSEELQLLRKARNILEKHAHEVIDNLSARL